MNMPIPKNSTEGYTEAWKRERERQMKYYQDCPYVGPLGKRMYDAVKSQIPSLIHASVCGILVSLVVYKQDTDKARHYLAQAFKVPVKQMECPYTEYVTLYLKATA